MELTLCGLSQEEVLSAVVRSQGLLGGRRDLLGVPQRIVTARWFS